MKIISSAIIALTLPLAAGAQDYIESFSHNKDFRGVERRLQYRPAEGGYIECTNGDNLYTRALYGGPTLFRVETSDRPIFAAYHKSENRNIHFTVNTGSGEQRLDSTAVCTALYRGGERVYHLSDPAWKGGSLTLTVLAPYDHEGAVWKIEPKDMPKGSTLTASSCATVKKKLNRSGDMGADPANAFAPDPELRDLSTATVNLANGQSPLYIAYADRRVSAEPQKELAAIYAAADSARADMVSRMNIVTPDPWFNTLGSSLAAAAEGIWDGQTYQHGAIGWRMPLSGWRGAYTGDFTGRHDRARTHFDAYAASQVTEVEPTIPHPTQDPKMAMARAEKKWGTQMYSNGYICRNPGKNNVMHHYDMNLCYIDELLWHLNWTGDLDYARKMWPVITAHLAWEKRNYDPDGDGLYDAYCCIWASDALYYNSGGVTHSSAYNYRANKMAAGIAEKIGEDPTPYATEAEKILAALNSVLWMDDKGVWAEFKDFMGNKRLHDHPAVWTIYHALDSDVADPLQAFSATRYIDRAIPHIPVRAEGLDDAGYATIATTDWLPYAWSINNVAFAEVMHTALAYWQAGRADEASHLLKSSMLDGMYIGNSPGNIGQISYYDAARGECYRDFADPVGVLSRAVVQGLFGFSPELLEERVNLRPGFPSDWDKASIEHSDFNLSFLRDGNRDSYTLTLLPSMQKAREVVYTLRAPSAGVESVKVNGKDVAWAPTPDATGTPSITFAAPATAENIVEVTWTGSPVESVAATPTGEERHGFRRVKAGDLTWWEELPRQAAAATPDYGLTAITGEIYEPVDLSGSFNASVTDIFRNRYLSPRSPYTTLQLPVQGIGEWCHPLDSAHIDDSGLRAAGRVITPQGVPFTTPAEGNNIVYTSLFDNYPDSVTVALSGKARALHLLLAGSTNHMQCHMENARVTVRYSDGTTEVLPLVPPHNWAPIEQDYFIDGKAFRVDTPRPLRVAFKDLTISDNLGRDLGIEGVYGRRIDGGAGVVLCLPLDPSRELSSMTLTTLSNDVVAGLMAATCLR